MSRGGVTVDSVDLMIASMSLAHDLTLVTDNTKHFHNIPDLRLGQLAHFLSEATPTSAEQSPAHGEPGQPLPHAILQHGLDAIKDEQSRAKREAKHQPARGPPRAGYFRCVRRKSPGVPDRLDRTVPGGTFLGNESRTIPRDVAWIQVYH